MAIAPQARAGTSGSVALASDYVFRGVSQTNQEPALQAGVEYAADAGFYIGSWGSSVSWLSDLSSAAEPISSSAELDAYAGFRGRFGAALGYDVGVLYYAYPGSFPSGFNSADTTELHAGITLSPAEPVTLGLKYSRAIGDLFGYPDSRGSGYLDASANWTFAPGWTVTLHGGKQWIAHNRAFDYTDWKLALARAFANGFSISAAWTDTDADSALYTNPYGNRIAGGTFVLTVAKAF